MIVKCPHCGFEEDAPEEYVGETAICDSCQGEYVVGGVAVHASSFDEQGNAAIECPYCQAQNSIRIEYANRNVRCCECDGKYHIQVQEQSPDMSEQKAHVTEQVSHQKALPPQREDEFVRFGGLNLLDKIGPGHIVSANGKSLFRFTLSLPLGISRPIVVMCKKCKRFDVALIRTGQWKMPLSCECGNAFLAEEGQDTFLSEIGKIKKFKNQGGKISALYRKFKTEERIFEGDWDAFIDPRSNLRIERIKSDIERLYKRLQISESNRLIASHDKQTGAIIAFANNWNSTLATVGGLISLMSNADKERSIGQVSMNLNQQLNQNERILNYYYDLVEEFTGVDKINAKLSRMKARTGYSSVCELPPLWSEQDALKCAAMMGKLNNYVVKRIRKIMMRPVICGVIIASLLFALMLVTVTSYSVDMRIVVALICAVIGSVVIMVWLINWFSSDTIEKLTEMALHTSTQKPKLLSDW